VNDQSPPSAFSSSNVHPSNMLPVILHPVNVASKNAHLVNVQFRNAAAVCLDTLKRTPRNEHSVNTAPLFTSSVMSTSTNRTRPNAPPDRSCPGQSSFLTVEVVSGAGIPCFLSAIA
jgi:hypothetical protein